MSQNDLSSLEVLDDMGYPSLDLIVDRNWGKAIAPDFPDVDQIISFCEVAKIAHLEGIDAVSINGNEVDRRELLPPDPSQVSKFLMEQSYATVVLAAEKKLFLYKDASDRFVVYFGELDLVKSVYRPSGHEADEIFYRWVLDAKLNPVETSSLMDKFDKYRSS